MKLFKYIYILPLLVFAVTACEDKFLDKPLQGQLNQENFPVSADDALSATNAVYSTLRDGNYHRGYFPIDDIMSDDASKGSNPDDGASTLLPFDKFEHTPTNTVINSWWRALYTGVRRANVVIEKVPSIEMDASLKNRYIGEAKFLRALFYFDLVRGFGGVPIVNSTTPESGMSKSSKDEVYNVIIGDLRNAIEMLPEKSGMAESNLGRATKGAAKALLSRTYLYKQQYDSAELYALEVINSMEYGLEVDFADANSVNGEFGIESVFEVGGVGAQNTTAGGNEYAYAQGVRGNPNRGYGFNRPTPDLINSFDNDDPRMEATVIFLGEVIDGVTIIGDDLTDDANETYNQKVWTPGATPEDSRAHNRRLIRYAEVLLNAAEALNENNKPAQALIYLNQVRARARGGDDSILPDITETAQGALRDLILEERRHELAMEGHRFWDLVRTGKAPQVLGPLGFKANKHEVLPIPQTEIDLTEGSLKQNDNW